MLGLLGEIPFVVLVIAGVCAPVAGWMAAERNRSPVLWGAFGLVTGPVAPIVLYLAPPGRCPTCATPISGWPLSCPGCGTRLAIIGGASSASSGGDLPIGDPTASAAASGDGASTAQSVPAGPPVATIAARPPRTRGVSIATRLARAKASGHGHTGPVKDGPGAPVPAGAPSPGTTPGAAPATAPAAALVRGMSGVHTPDPTSEEVLATGIYVSGNAGMSIGALYAVARFGERLRVFGPVDVGDLTTRLELPLAQTDVTATDDRIVILGRGERGSTTIILRAVGGRRGVSLETALAMPGASAAGSTEAESPAGHVAGQA